MLPKSTALTIYELHKKIRLQKLQIESRNNIIEELQEQVLKCHRCRQLHRGSDGSKS